VLVQQVRRLRDSTALKAVARAGLLARGGFYLLLAALALRVAWSSGQDGEANANGVLGQVARHSLGVFALVAAAVGFAAYGVIRLMGAATNDRQGRLRRASTAGQGLMYLALSGMTWRYLLGDRSTGSEEQQRRTADEILALPGGRWVIGAAGLVLIGVCGWQLLVAVRGHFEETLHTEDMTGQLRALVRLVARIGIPARALALVPVGAALVVAAVRVRPQAAKGLDAVLGELADSGAGRVLVAVVACGFAIFGVYSLLEARYRQVSSGA
jgi:hypothetical protein